MESFLVYCILFLTTIFLIKKNEKVGLLFLSIFSGLRTNVGTDFNAYISIYYNELLEKGIFETKFDEYGFLILTKIAVILGSYRWMFLFSSILTLFFIFYGIKKINKNNYILIFLIFLFMYYPISFNSIRQSIAQSIVIYGVSFIINKKFFKFVFFVLLASLFHKTAIIMFPFYFIFNSKHKVNKKYFNIVFICMIISIIFYKDILILFSRINKNFFRYIQYIQSTTIGKNLDFYFKIFQLIGLTFFRKKLIKKDNENLFYIYMFIISIGLNYLGFYNIFLKRWSLYFEIYFIFLISNISNLFKEEQRKYIRKIIYFFIIIYFYTIYVFLGHHTIVPYKFL